MLKLVGKMPRYNDKNSIEINFFQLGVEIRLL